MGTGEIRRYDLSNRAGVGGKTPSQSLPSMGELVVDLCAGELRTAKAPMMWLKHQLFIERKTDRGCRASVLVVGEMFGTWALNSETTITESSEVVEAVWRYLMAMHGIYTNKWQILWYYPSGFAYQMFPSPIVYCLSKTLQDATMCKKSKKNTFLCGS